MKCTSSSSSECRKLSVPICGLCRLSGREFQRNRDVAVSCYHLMDHCDCMSVLSFWSSINIDIAGSIHEARDTDAAVIMFVMLHGLWTVASVCLVLCCLSYIFPTWLYINTSFLCFLAGFCLIISFNPLIPTLKPQSSRPLYSNAVTGTLAVDWWAVTFGTARRGLDGGGVMLWWCVSLDSRHQLALWGEEVRNLILCFLPLLV